MEIRAPAITAWTWLEHWRTNNSNSHFSSKGNLKVFFLTSIDNDHQRIEGKIRAEQSIEAGRDRKISTDLDKTLTKI